MKKSFYTFFCSIFLFFNLTYAQNPSLVWANAIHNPSVSNYGLNYIEEVVVDKAGNYYVIGSFEQPLDMDPSANTYTLTPPTVNYDAIVIAKYNPAGNPIWAFTLGNGAQNRGYDIFLDSKNNLYVTGQARDTIDFDPGPGKFKLCNNVKVDYAFVAKYDTSGAFINAFHITNGQSIGHGVCADSSGNIYVTGEYASKADFDPSSGTYYLTSNKSGIYSSWDIFYAKYSPTGSLLWAKSLGTSAAPTYPAGNHSEYGACIAVNNINGNVAIGGEYGNGKALFLLVDSNGTTVKNYYLTDESTSSGVAFDNQGNLYFSGDYGWNNATEDFDWNASTYNLLPTGTHGLGFIIKYDSTHAIQWGTRIINTSQYNRNLEISIDDQNDVLFVGSEASTASSSLIFFGKAYASAGTIAWKSIITGGGSGGNNENLGNGIGYSAIDSTIIIAGVIGQNYKNPCTIDADPGSGTYNLVTVAGMELFMGKYGSCAGAPVQPVAISGPDTVCAGTNQTYSVSNVQGANSYSWSLPAGWSGSGTDTSINVTVGSNGGNISITANNNCGSSAAQSILVYVNTVDTSVSQAGNTLTSNNGSSGVTYQWLDCNNNYAVIAGATGKVYTASANGSYAVQVTENGCVDTSRCYTITGVGIDGFSKSDLNIYPNPSDGLFTVRLSNDILSSLKSMSVTDIVGHDIWRMKPHGSVEVIDLHDQPKGIYFLRFTSDNGTTTKKIVIK